MCRCSVENGKGHFCNLCLSSRQTSIESFVQIKPPTHHECSPSDSTTREVFSHFLHFCKNKYSAVRLATTFLRKCLCEELPPVIPFASSWTKLQQVAWHQKRWQRAAMASRLYPAPWRLKQMLIAPGIYHLRMIFIPNLQCPRLSESVQSPSPAIKRISFV